MNSHLIYFKNRNNEKEKTDTIQIDDSTDVNGMSDILRTLLNSNSNYCFFYKNNRIVIDLSSIIKEFDLNIEETIEIEYIDEDSFKADSFKEYADVVTDLSHFEGKIFYRTFQGEIFDLNSEKSICSNKKGLFSGYCFDDYSLYTIDKNLLIYTFSDKIQCGNCFDQNIAIATEKEILMGNSKEFISIKTHDSFIRKLKLDTNAIYWLEEYNKVYKYDIFHQTTSFIKTEYSLNDFVLIESKVYTTTANNKILEINKNNVKEYNINSRFSQNIISLNDSIIYSTQNELITASLELCEKNYFRVRGQINSVEVDGDKVYIAHDNFISIFMKNTLNI